MRTPMEIVRHLEVASDLPAGWPQLPEAALSGPAGDIVQELVPHTEADPAALLVDLLVSYGNAVGPGAHAEVEAQQHPARLFAAIVGKTGKSRKGSSHRQVYRLMQAADPEWAAVSELRGLGSGEGLIENLAKSEGGDLRRLVVEEEFVRLIAVAERQGATLSPIIRAAWDGGRLQIVTRANPARVDGLHHVSIIAHTTLEELRRRLVATEVVNGFANRFLFALARRDPTRLLPHGNDFEENELAFLAEILRKRLEEARRIRRRMVFVGEARDRWEEIYRDLAKDDAIGLASAATARGEAQVLRLSVAHALFDATPEIDVGHLEAAYALWRYCEASARYIWGDASGDPVEDRIVEAVRASGSAGITVEQERELFSRNVSAQRREHARDRAVAAGRIVAAPEETGGRPRTVLRLPTR